MHKTFYTNHCQHKFLLFLNRPASSTGGRWRWKKQFPIIWSKTNSESVGHAAYDVLGIHRASLRPVYGIARAEVTPLANTVVHVIAKGNHTFSATVDGRGVGGNYLLGEWMVLADWNPAVYDLVANAAIASRRYANNANLTAYILWMKHRRASGVSPTPSSGKSPPPAPR